MRLTQERLKARVDALLTLAISSIFDRPFTFNLEFERKRNRLECTPKIMEGSKEYVPKEDMGGGIIDITSFAMRVVLWSIENPKVRNLFILDEPMKFVGKGELLNRAGNVLREIADRLNVQLIVVTHESELAQMADTKYIVTHDGNSKVERAE